MNKTALGFGIGLVLIAAAAVAYLAMVGGGPQEAKAPDTKITPAEPADAAPVSGEEVEPQPAAAATPTPAPEPEPQVQELSPELANMKEPPKIPQPDVVTPTKLAFTRTIPDAQAYAEKETIDVLLRVELVSGNDPVRAMGMQEQIPEGYALEAYSGPRQPEVKPPAGTRGMLEMAWIQFPTDFFPAEFGYRLKKVGTPPPSPQFSGQVLFRTSGEELRTDVVKSLLGSEAEAAASNTPAPAEAPAATPTPEAAAAPAPAADAAAAPENMPKTSGASLHIGRVAKAEGYTAGQPVELEVVVEQQGEGQLGAVAVVETIPAGWTFEAVTGGTAPPIKPNAGAEGNLSFIFIQVPPFPLTFSYSIKPPAEATGEAQVKGKVVYRADNAPLESAELVTTLAQK